MFWGSVLALNVKLMDPLVVTVESAILRKQEFGSREVCCSNESRFPILPLIWQMYMRTTIPPVRTNEILFGFAQKAKNMKTHSIGNPAGVVPGGRQPTQIMPFDQFTRPIHQTN